MTMLWMFNLILITTCLSSAYLKNPVEMSFALLIYSAVTFIYISLSSSQVWYPMIFFLIFMGGILMMFMILSSILPNEKSYKNKNFIFSASLVLVFSSMLKKFSETEGVMEYLKSSMDSSSCIFFLILMMSFYFFITMTIMSKEETPLRSCY